jgi:predicted transcriptional regulator
MAPPPDKISELTDLQLAVMRAVWRAGPATLAVIHAEVSRSRDLAISTVGTLLGRLRKQRLVAAAPEGRHLVYRALVSEAEVKQSTTRRLMERLFGGDSVALVQHLLASGSVRASDARKIRTLIDDKAGDARK